MKARIRRLRSSSMASLLGLACLCILAGCAAKGESTSPSSFAESDYGALRVGMTADQVREMFGDPGLQFDMEFGHDIGEPWTGRAWVYFTDRDPRFKHIKRKKKTLFVFYPPDGDMRLNHWVIE